MVGGGASGTLRSPHPRPLPIASRGCNKRSRASGEDERAGRGLQANLVQARWPVEEAQRRCGLSYPAAELVSIARGEGEPGDALWLCGMVGWERTRVVRGVVPLHEEGEPVLGEG